MKFYVIKFRIKFKKNEQIFAKFKRKLRIRNKEIYRKFEDIL